MQENNGFYDDKGLNFKGARAYKLAKFGAKSGYSLADFELQQVITKIGGNQSFHLASGSYPGREIGKGAATDLRHFVDKGITLEIEEAIKELTLESKTPVVFDQKVIITVHK